jgi:outer membrane protein
MRAFYFLITLLYTFNSWSSVLHRVLSSKPLYELGVVGGYGYVPDYPAAGQGRMRYIIFPIFRYRGLRFRSDEEDSARARIFLHPHYGIDLNATGSFPAYSQDNDARKDMPNLDWMGEFGPRIYIFLHRTDKFWWRLFFPARLAYSTDFSTVTQRGMVFAQSMNFRYFFDDTRFNSITLSISRNYATEKFQDYYFEVSERFVTPERPKYKATGGYLGSSAGLAFIHEKNQIGLYAGLGVNSYKGAANSGSPLHKSDYTYGAFVGFSYFFYESVSRGYMQ